MLITINYKPGNKIVWTKSCFKKYRLI